MIRRSGRFAETPAACSVRTRVPPRSLEPGDSGDDGNAAAFPEQSGTYSNMSAQPTQTAFTSQEAQPGEEPALPRPMQSGSVDLSTGDVSFIPVQSGRGPDDPEPSVVISEEDLESLD